MVRSLVRVLEVVDQLLGPRLVVVDDPAELPPYCGYISLKTFCEQHGVVVVAGEDDRSCRRWLPVASRMPFSIRLRRIDPVGVLVEDVLIEVLARRSRPAGGGPPRLLELGALLGGHLAST